MTSRNNSMDPLVALYGQGHTLSNLIYVFSLKEDDLEILLDNISPNIVRKHNKNLRKSILKMYKDGYPIKVISQSTGLSSNAVWNMICSK